MRKYNYIYSILLLSILTSILFFPVLFLGKTYFLRDITYIFHPWKALCAEAIQKGEMPLWDPYAYCGMPLLANWQTAVFYPFSLLFYIFSFSTALKAFHSVQIILAGYFAYLFIRGERGNISAAIAVMLLFAFNGFVITKLEFLSYIGVISWTFALLLLRKNPLILAAAICLSFLGGHQIFVFQILALLIYGLLECISCKFSLMPLKNILTAGAIALGLTAVQLLPTLELISHSYRNKAGIDYSIAMLHSLNFQSLLGLISPLFYKAKLDLVGGEYLQWDTTMYIGIFGSIAALIGIFSKPFCGKKSIGLVLILLGLVLALGDSTPIYPWLYKHLFIFHTMRYPVQYVYFTIIGLMILVGEGICNFKYTYIVCGLVAIELLASSANFQPVTESNFFNNKPAAAAALQSLCPNCRFILSPGAEVDRHITAKSIPIAWQGARDRLYNLTCLPYHLQNAFGFGEPLTGFAIETQVNELYKLPNAQAALNKYSAFGVRYILCKQKLADNSGYQLVADKPLYIYELSSYPSIIEAGLKSTSAEVNYDRSTMSKYLIRSVSVQPDIITFKQCYFPGWRLYLNGLPAQFTITESTFVRWNVPKGITKGYYVYKPASFTAGLSISILTLLAIILLSLKKLHKRKYETA